MPPLIKSLPSDKRPFPSPPPPPLLLAVILNKHPGTLFKEIGYTTITLSTRSVSQIILFERPLLFWGEHFVGLKIVVCAMFRCTEDFEIANFAKRY